jgi:rubrerythrin
MNTRKVYEYALSRERQGKEFFLTNSARMSHAAAKGIFARLAQEEDRHIQFIQALIQALDGQGHAESGSDVAEVDLFSQRAAEESLDQSVIESMVPDVAILRTAYLIERDFAEFYEMAALKTEGEARSVLSALARWERGHERLFKDLHDRVFQEYAEMPWGG